MRKKLCISKHFVYTFLLLLTLCLKGGIPVYAATPGNDGCAAPQTIAIDGNGFATGTFTATDVDITDATIENGETFAPALLVASLNQKSIWYKFTLPTTRSIRVTLSQPGVVITAGDVGFAVYKSNSCLPATSALSSKLTPIATFGNTYHPCVEPGEYLVQVSAKTIANGPVTVKLDVEIPSGSLYDEPTNAYQFGAINVGAKGLDFNVDCLSLNSEDETCTSLTDYKKYTKSAWFTFITPAYFDYLSFLLSSPVGNFPSGTKIFGYNLYKGDARNTPVESLTLVDGCDTLATNGYYPDWKQYTCSELDATTTYTIQLFFHEDFYNDVRIALTVGGYESTHAPRPLATMPTTNRLGVLPASPSGIQQLGRDFLGCNSRMSSTACEPALPASGIKVGNTNWNLSTYFTFELATASYMNFYVYPEYPGNCGPNYYCRIFKQDVTDDCSELDTANIIHTFSYHTILDCMEPGKYTIQILGTDTAISKTDLNYGWLTNRGTPICLFNNLGSKVLLQMTTATRRGSNKFDLSSSGAFDSINVVNGQMSPLLENIVYDGIPDTVGCQNTLMPDTTPICTNNSDLTKAIFREFVVQDSGVVSLIKKDGPFTFKLYRGDASAKAAVQGKSGYPETIEGLTPYTPCMDYYTYCYEDRVCIVPDTFTLVSMGNQTMVGRGDRASFRLNFFSTKHRTPALAQDLGNIIDSMTANNTTFVRSDDDYFTCIDNIEDIPAYTPCNIGGAPATKVIYRQFYLKEESLLSIRDPQNCVNNGYFTLFSGKITDDGLAGLTPMGAPWNCFTSASSSQCGPMQPGWYTIIAYGTGPTYENPLQNAERINGIGSHIGYVNFFTISVEKACPGPKFNKPATASVNTTNNLPHLIQWGPRVGHTAAYPKTDTTYTLPTENWNCTIDTPFTHLTSCAANMTKVAYWVFRLTQESYVQINTGGYWAAVYDKDVRTNNLKALTPLQTCLQNSGQMQICRMQPGTYTLAVFAPNSNGCQSLSPTIYIDQVGYSRFDHAAKAYDFGRIPPDSAWHSGKVGAVNPLNSARAASNDFFYCTTGAQKTDPTESACYTKYTPSIYNTNTNNTLYTTATQPAGHEIAQRNLWYTFVVDQPGWVSVKLNNKTIGKNFTTAFAIYKSDESGTIPFTTLQSTGKVDSTTTQGLQFIGNNFIGYYCYTNESIRFYRDPCNNKSERYYIVATNMNPYPNFVHSMNPNHQIELSILLDSIIYPPTKFDHYTTTNNIGDNLGIGTYSGEQDNFSCATAKPLDPVFNGVYYAQKTLWYKFSTTITGHVRFGATRGKTWQYDYPNVQVFREAIPGDSTTKGLIYRGASSVYGDGKYWGETCISPGTYYLILTGYNAVDEYTQPTIQIREDSGDFCSAPVVIKMPQPGIFKGSALVDCHTIGTDYGEFGPNLTCPENAKTNEYKSTWYRLDVTGKDTLDITVFLDEQTNAASADIKYRLMTGNCGAMQEQSCVQDALTRNTYECLTPGSYYIQVLTPMLKNGAAVNGVLNLNVEAKLHSGLCAPITQCLVNANFIPQFDCTKDTSVRFVNYSTFGTDIKYKWDFGYNNQTSSEVSPAFFYPALTVEKTYTIKLEATNTTCGKTETATATVKVPARPYINLGPDRQLCTPGSTLILDATSWPGATYQWHNGSTDSTFTVTAQGNNRYSVKVTYNNCEVRDTVNVFINNITKKPLQNFVLCIGQAATLNVNRGQGEIYKWNTGATTNQISASVPGYYWADITLYGCTIRDSFLLESVDNSARLGADRAVCFSNSAPYILNATTVGATSYTWQDGSTNPTFQVKAAGKYWVDIVVGSCFITDTVILTQAPALTISLPATATVCQGDSVLLDAGAGYATYAWSNGAISRTIWAKTGGNYRVTVTNGNGCTALSNNIAVTVRQKPKPKITGVLLSCNNVATTLDAGAGYQNYIWSTGEKTHTIKTSFLGKIIVTVTDNFNCVGKDSVTVNGNKTVIRKNIDTTICANNTYTSPSGKIHKVAGVYSDTLKAISGCDSLINSINLKVIVPILKNIDTTICEKASYTMPAGRIITQPGTYKDTLKNKLGCDSLITTLRLKVFLITQQTIDTTICEKSVFVMPAGAIIRLAGVYKDTLKNAAGCDSLITTATVKVSPISYKTIDTTICENEQYKMPGGAIITTSGTYTDTLKNKAGCDSLITRVNLSVFRVILRNLQPAICEGDDYSMPSGKVISQSGVYLDTIRAKNGCDSLITTITLTVKQPTRKDTTISICAGTSYKLPSGSIVNTAGVYKTIITASNGCDSVITTTLTVGLPLAVNVVANPTVICAGETSTLTAVAAGGNSANYTYTWQAANSSNSTVTVQPNTTTKYTVTLTDNCSLPAATASTTVTVHPLPKVQFTLAPNDGCSPLSVTFSHVAESGTQYNWIFGDGTTGNLPSPTHIYTAAGVYTVTLRAENTGGCKSSSTISNAVRVYAPPIAAFETSPNPNMAFNRTIEFLDRSTGATSWAWQFGDRQGTSSMKNPIYEYRDTGTFSTRLIVKNEQNCSDTANLLTVISGIGKTVYIPNAFTPNKDGKNDFFRIFGANIRSAKMAIFNRYGEKVYDGDGYTGKWDGRHMKNGQECISGAYIYAVTVVDKLGTEKFYKGTVTLIR
jgi:gliding motility-associated-like protein